MPDQFAPPGEDRAQREGRFAAKRRPDRTYLSKTVSRPGQPGVPARYIHKVFDTETATELELTADGTEWLVKSSPTGRTQVKLLVSREPGHVTEVWVQHVTYSGKGARAKNLLNLAGDDARRLVELLRNLDFIPVEGGRTVRIDDAFLADLRAGGQVPELYAKDPDAFRQLISDDATARDVVALRRRRSEVARFRRLLHDSQYFDSQVPLTKAKRPEDVWQEFFEENPWILGTGFSGQLYTSWDESKLEQVVGGASVALGGKRVDALMRTSGIIRWLVFAEFKTHRKPLLAAMTRPDAYPPSPDLVAGVAQAQETVRRAIKDIDQELRRKAPDGADLPGEVTYLTRPRSFLLIGQLSQLRGEDGGPHLAKITSFELFRQALTDPEVVTFDELLARAEWVVDTDGAG